MTNNLTLNGTVAPGLRRGRVGRRAVRDRSAAGAVLSGEAAVLPRGARAVQRAAQRSSTRAHRQARRGAQAHRARWPARASAFLTAADDPSLSSSGHDRDGVQHPARAARHRRPVADRHGVHRSRRSAATTTASPTSTAAWCSATCTTASFQYAQSFDKTRDVVRNAPLWDGSARAQRQAIRFPLLHERHRRATSARSAGSSRAPGIVHGADRSSRDLVQRARIDRSRRSPATSCSTTPGSTRTSCVSGDAQDKKFHVERERRSARRMERRRRRVLGDVRLGHDSSTPNYRIERTVGTRSTRFRSSASGEFRIATTCSRSRRRSGRVQRERCCTSAARTRTSSSGRRRTSTIVSLTVNVRPSDHLRVDGTLRYQDYWRRTDHTLVGRNVIPRVKVEYQFTRSIFLRVVGEYDLSRDTTISATRRERSTRCSSTAQNALATRRAHCTATVCSRISPSPGTVFFLGYGSAGERPARIRRERFNFQPITRSSDYFFVKYQLSVPDVALSPLQTATAQRRDAETQGTSGRRRATRRDCCGDCRSGSHSFREDRRRRTEAFRAALTKTSGSRGAESEAPRLFLCGPASLR